LKVNSGGHTNQKVPGAAEYSWTINVRRRPGGAVLSRGILVYGREKERRNSAKPVFKKVKAVWPLETSSQTTARHPQTN